MKSAGMKASSGVWAWSCGGGRSKWPHGGAPGA